MSLHIHIKKYIGNFDLAAVGLLSRASPSRHTQFFSPGALCCPAVCFAAFALLAVLDVLAAVASLAAIGWLAGLCCAVLAVLAVLDVLAVLAVLSCSLAVRLVLPVEIIGGSF